MCSLSESIRQPLTRVARERDAVLKRLVRTTGPQQHRPVMRRPSSSRAPWAGMTRLPVVARWGRWVPQQHAPRRLLQHSRASGSTAPAPALPGLWLRGLAAACLTFQVSLARDQRAAANTPQPATPPRRSPLPPPPLLKLVFKTTALCWGANKREQAGAWAQTLLFRLVFTSFPSVQDGSWRGPERTWGWQPCCLLQKAGQLWGGTLESLAATTPLLPHPAKNSRIIKAKTSLRIPCPLLSNQDSSK